MGVGVVIAAAGSGQRMGDQGNKTLLNLRGKPMVLHSIEVFAALPRIQEIVVVTRRADLGSVQRLVSEAKLSTAISVIAGGKERQDSVRYGLEALPAKTKWVIIHDGARPYITSEITLAALEACYRYKAVGVAVPVKDTIKVVRDGLIRETPQRSELWMMQTPQVFSYPIIVRAHQHAHRKGFKATDDCALVEALGIPVHIVLGDYANIKVTTPEDLTERKSYLVGFGYDVHRLADNRPLILAGIEIPFERGLEGHSDADVAAHAVMDALLGAAGLGDIGEMFPDTDPQYKGISSLKLLAKVCAFLDHEQLFVNNLDLTIMAEKPKLAPWKNKMRTSLARVLGISEARINIKATTTEGLGFVGKGEGIAAQAAASLVRSPD